jgi:hypothetical protein
MVSTNLAFRILATDDGASKVMSSIGASSDHLHGRLSLLSKGSERFGAVTRDAFKLAAGAVLGAGLIEGLKSLYTEGQASNLVSKQTEAVIKSTGGAAHVTADQVGDLATAISDKTAVDDEAIQSGANLLLTFTGIRNEAGKGNDIFNQATMAVTDMTAAMNGGAVSQEGLKAQSILVGKALNDPIAGLSALARVGVTFTAQQKDQIKVMVQSGDTLGAQKVILRELGKEFGGSAEAAATGAKRLGIAIGNIKESIGQGLVRVVDEAGNSLADRLPGALAAASGAFGLIEGPIVRIGTDLRTLFIPLMHDGAEAVKPLAVLVGGTLVVGLRLLADVLDFVAQHEGVFIPLAEGALAFLAASKGIGAATGAWKSLFGRGGVLDGVQARLLYAGDGMRALAAGENIAKLGALGLAGVVGVAALGLDFLATKHAEAKARVEEFSAALKADSGAIGENTRAAVANRLEKDGVLKAAQAEHISLSLVTDAVLGNSEAIGALNGKYEEYNTKAIGPGRNYDSHLANLGKVRDAVNGVGSSLNDAVGGYHRVDEATGEVTGATRNMTAEQKAAAAQFAAEKLKADALWTSLTNLANVNLSAMSAGLAMQAAIIDVDGSLKGLDGTTRRQTLSLAGNTAAGNTARQTLIQHVQAALADGEAQKARTGKTDLATRAVQGDIAALRQHYLNLGYNKQAVDAVITSLGNLGKQHPKATAKVDTSQANRAIDDLNRKLTLLDGRVVTTVAYNFQEDIFKAAGGGVKAHKASGGLFKGWSWLGERGPELGYTPDTTAVFTTEQSRQMIASFGGPAGGGGGHVVHNYYITVSGVIGDEDATVRRIAQGMDRLTRNGHSVRG